MIIIRQKSFSDKMSTKKFKETEKEIVGHYKSGLGHMGAAGVNTAIAGALGKKVKEGKNKKLALAGAGISAANAVYHIGKSGEHFKKGYKLGRNPEYQKKLDEVLDKENAREDKEFEKLQKAEDRLKKDKEAVKSQEKKLGIRSRW